MELLRRALLLGCVLPGLWMLRLTFLEPMVAISPAAGVQGEMVAPGSGPGWNRLLEDLSALGKGRVPPRLEGQVTSASPGPDGRGFRLFLPAFGGPLDANFRDLVDAGGSALLSVPSHHGEGQYRVDLHAWTGADFRPGDGFTGQPRPPESLLYPLRFLGMILLLVGTALFTVLPSPIRSEGSMTLRDTAMLTAVLVFFSLPLFAVGGSVQALTRAPWLTLPCWLVAAACMHLFARPTHHLHLQLLPAAPEASRTLSDALRHPAFVRMGAVFLGVAIGPLLAVVAVSTVLWNR